MIIVSRFRGKFRERAPEWVMSACMVWWGILTLITPGLFNDQTLYYPLSLIMSQPFWGTMALVIGLSRLVSLVINGLWRPTAHLRAIGAIGGILIWTSLLLASLSTEGRVLGIPIFIAFLLFDTLALWWAAGDARLADDLAKKNKGA